MGAVIYDIQKIEINFGGVHSMVTRIDDYLKDFMITLMEEDSLNAVAFQTLLNRVRESFGLDVVYTLEKVSIDRKFAFRFMSVSKPEYDTVGKVIQLTQESYEHAIHMYDKHHICGYNVQDAEKYAISDNVLHYGYVRCNNQVYDGSVGFQQFKKHVWSEEEQAALIKLGRVYGLIFNKELTKELNDNLFESLRAEEIMKYRAEHDALTGIPNRIGFDEMIGRLKKEQFPLAFALVDVDSFKIINDTYGHEIGDKILVKVAQVLDSAFRSSDSVFRIGGDEFAILFNNIAENQKDFIIRKIQNINDSLQNPIDGLPPTALSVGVAYSSGGYRDELFNCADKALYEVKKRGKCGVFFYQE